MHEMVENRMVVEPEWEWQKTVSGEFAESAEERLNGAGYLDSSGTFVPRDDAYTYALEHCLGGTEEEQTEFKEMLVDWFYQEWKKVDG